MALPGPYTKDDEAAESRLRKNAGVGFLGDFAVNAYRVARFARGRNAADSEAEAWRVAILMWEGFWDEGLEEELVGGGGGACECVRGDESDDEAAERLSREFSEEGDGGDEEDGVHSPERGIYHYRLTAELVQHYLSHALHNRDEAYQGEPDEGELADKAVRLADAVVARLEE